ncbi:MAG: pyruvate synthase [Planctomycetes bacterium SM23_25]|nr:MAG: pyruvate synthase [Planctomycetes bacterium DG_20]KPK51101.1 MAG: pyruvate synthase [Planctomycetes bacterium SM23_25]
MSDKLLSLERLSIGCVAPPGGSVANKTGAWRTMIPVFKQEACIGCRACELVCPEGCVFGNPKEKKFTFDPDYCKGCGMCAAECPEDDIDMVREEK